MIFQDDGGKHRTVWKMRKSTRSAVTWPQSKGPLCAWAYGPGFFQGRSWEGRRHRKFAQLHIHPFCAEKSHAMSPVTRAPTSWKQHPGQTSEALVRLPETLPLTRLLSPSGAKTNRQNQLLDLEKVPETPARGDGGGGGGRVVSGLSSHEPGQPLPETNRSTRHSAECFLWEMLVKVYPLT